MFLHNAGDYSNLVEDDRAQVLSIAVREGVIKNLKVTEKHFRNIYGKVPYSYYEYDSSKINLIRQFSRSNKIEIIIMTISSFNKDTNIMNQHRDSLHGQKPIDLVKKTNPILILDEPQNMESELAKGAISDLNPLFTLRYSATHCNYYNLVYSLTPVAAYHKNLVKKIEVMSVVEEDDFNSAFIRCIDITANPRGIKAKLEVIKKAKNGFKIAPITVNLGDNLFEKTDNRQYNRFVVTGIHAKEGLKFSNGIEVKPGEEKGTSRTHEDTNRTSCVGTFQKT